MKPVQFQVKTLLLVTLGVAAVTFWMIPFSPKIVFGPLTHSSLTVVGVGDIRCLEISIQNRGSEPIWLAASTPERPAYKHTYPDPSIIEFSSIAKKWCRVDAGGSVIIKPINGSKPFRRICILASDWRGRKVVVGVDPGEPPATSILKQTAYNK